MTHKQEFFKRNNIKDESLSLREISALSGVSVADLKKIDDRGKGAWKTNIKSVRMKGTFKKNVDAPRSAKLSAEAWSRSRIYAFVNKLDKVREGKTKTINQDFDIAKKYVKNIKFKK